MKPSLISKSTLPGFILLLWSLLSVWSTARAQTLQGQIGDVQTTHASYLIAAQGSDEIQIAGNLVLSSPAIPGTGGSGHFRLLLRLLDTEGQAVDLLDADLDGNTMVKDDGLTEFGALENQRVVDFELGLRPGQSLVPGQIYTLRLDLQRRDPNTLPDVFVWEDLDDREEHNSYYHFPSLDSGDADANVLVAVTSISQRRNVALQNTSNGFQAFELDVAYEVLRFDGFDDPPTVDWIRVEFTYHLFDGDGNEIPLAGNSKVLDFELASHVMDMDALPSLLELEETFSIVPQVFLPDPNQDFRLEVTANWSAVPGLPPPEPLKTGATAVLEDLALFHLSGRLVFGPMEEAPFSVDSVLATLTELDPEEWISAVENPGPPAYHEFQLELLVGTLDADNGFSFSAGPHTVRRLANGDLFFAESQTLTAGNSGGYLTGPGGLRYRPLGAPEISLTSQGATADLELLLPAGMGWRPDQSSPLLNNRMNFVAGIGSLPLTGGLFPSASTLSFSVGGGFQVVTDNAPVWMAVSAVVWEPATGTLRFDPLVVEHVRKPHLDALLAQDVDFTDDFLNTTLVSNDLYWMSVDASAAPAGDTRVRARASDGAVALTAIFSGGPGHFYTHFPWKVLVEWDDSLLIAFVDGELDADASEIAGCNEIFVRYNASCFTGDCSGSAILYRYAAMAPENGKLLFTPDGGLYAPGTALEVGFNEFAGLNLFYENESWASAYIAEPGLKWGMPDEWTDPAHAARDLGDPRFVTSGVRLSAAALAGTGEEQVNALFLSGWNNPRTAATFERPGSPEYLEGLAAYPGVSIAAISGSKGDASLGGSSWVGFDLSASARYYVRNGGVSGAHGAAATALPHSVHVYGYDMELQRFEWAFLDTAPADSRTEATLTMPYPADVTLELKNLRLSCFGDLLGADSPAAPQRVFLSYWNADLDVNGIRFDRKAENNCSPGNGVLTLDVRGYLNRMPGQFSHGSLGMLPDGNFLTAHDVEEDPDQLLPESAVAWLRLPSTLVFEGPVKVSQGRRDQGDVDRVSSDGDVEAAEVREQYAFYPSGPAFLNNYRESGHSDPENDQGHVSLAGMLNVEFFPDIPVHIAASPKEEGITGMNILGGYMTPIFSVPLVREPETDLRQRGFDYNVASMDEYLNGGPENDPHIFLPAANYHWLGFIPFNYPLKWSDSLLRFRSPEKQDTNLVIFNTETEVLWLSASQCSITIGAGYKGEWMPSLGALIGNAVTAGLYDDLKGVLSEGLTEVLFDGMKETKTLDDDKGYAIVERAMAKWIWPEIDTLVQNLNTEWSVEGANWDPEAVVDSWIAASLSPKTTSMITPTPVPQKGTLMAEVNESAIFLENVLLAIWDRVYFERSLMVPLRTVDPFNQSEPPSVYYNFPNSTNLPSPGVLYRANPQEKFTVLANTTRVILYHAFPDIPLFAAGGGGLVSYLDRVLDSTGATDSLAPTYESLAKEAEKLHGVMRATRLGKLLQSTAGAEGPVYAYLDGRVGEFINGSASKPGSSLETLNDYTNAVRAQILAEIAKTLSNGGTWEEWSDEEKQTAFRRSAMEPFLKTAVFKEYKTAMKGLMKEPVKKLMEKVDLIFAYLPGIVLKAITNDLDKESGLFNSLNGKIAGPVKETGIKGSATIVDNAIRNLRVDLSLKLDLGKENQPEFNAFIQIQQQKSIGSGSCSLPAGIVSAPEVTFGALDTSVLGLGTNLRVDAYGRMDFLDEGGGIELAGMGGGLSRRAGYIGFGDTFKIEDFGFAMMFGERENYVAAKLGMKFDTVKIHGGFYAGVACDLTPLLIVDKDVTEIVKTPPFTGVYVYGEGMVPLVPPPATCAFSMSAGAGLGAFSFAEGPTVGGKLKLMAEGQILCLLNLKVGLSGLGADRNGVFSFLANGDIKVQIGPCPLCLPFEAGLKAVYTPDQWDVQFR